MQPLGLLLRGYALAALAAALLAGSPLQALLILWIGGAAATLGLGYLRSGVRQARAESHATAPATHCDADLRPELERWERDRAEDREAAAADTLRAVR